MAKDKVLISDYIDPYGRERERLSWWCADESEEGACLGEGGEEVLSDASLQKIADSGDLAEWQFRTSERVASQTKRVERDDAGFYWETLGDARAALGEVRAALRCPPDRPMPPWAITASAAGWRAPKGWKP